MQDKPTTPDSKPSSGVDHTLYQIVAARRLGYDTMMWQAPVLSLTAQAFLLTIALGEGGALGRFMSGLLALLAAMSSLHLMVKHRASEVCDSRWLKDYETRWFDRKPIHGVPSEREFFDLTFWTKTSSYRVWWWTLAIFGLAGFLTALNAAREWSWLGPANQ